MITVEIKPFAVGDVVKFKTGQTVILDEQRNERVWSARSLGGAQFIFRDDEISERLTLARGRHYRRCLWEFEGGKVGDAVSVRILPHLAAELATVTEWDDRGITIVQIPSADVVLEALGGLRVHVPWDRVVTRQPRCRLCYRSQDSITGLCVEHAAEYSAHPGVDLELWRAARAIELAATLRMSHPWPGLIGSRCSACGLLHQEDPFASLCAECAAAWRAHQQFVPIEHRETLEAWCQREWEGRMHHGGLENQISVRAQRARQRAEMKVHPGWAEPPQDAIARAQRLADKLEELTERWPKGLCLVCARPRPAHLHYLCRDCDTERQNRHNMTIDFVFYERVRQPPRMNAEQALSELMRLRGDDLAHQCMVCNKPRPGGALALCVECENEWYERNRHIRLTADRESILEFVVRQRAERAKASKKTATVEGEPERPASHAEPDPQPETQKSSAADGAGLRQPSPADLQGHDSATGKQHRLSKPEGGPGDAGERGSIEQSQATGATSPPGCRSETQTARPAPVILICCSCSGPAERGFDGYCRACFGSMHMDHSDLDHAIAEVKGAKKAEQKPYGWDVDDVDYLVTG